MSSTSTDASPSSPSKDSSRTNAAEPSSSVDPKKKLLVLISNGLVDRTQSSNQSSSLALLNARGTPYETLDGMELSNRARRNELFAASGIRGNYPQLFLVGRDGGVPKFWGGWDRLSAANEAGDIPREVLEANPGIETWEGAFGNVVAEFS
eukprot:CAMPEP_0113572050 /NCGR_PEP_ID=MMETSP0015_2-20120614/25886_1 /TAXON_ID=2838 /ORGANISM="Odontella" /LENGTH=150 /DNA_ID=CAMNT_0000475053 /DNA_START=213 /DNA_END=665 /DNA_ORIENTATION=- /assembly_acc=CAM_ASM_000160